MPTKTEEDIPDLVVTSRTQSPEYIKKFLEDQGYQTEVTEINDEVFVLPVGDPENPDAPLAEDVVTEPVVETPPVPEIVPEPPKPADPPKPKPGSAKLKERLEKTKQELEAKRLENEQLLAELTSARKAAKPEVVPPAAPVVVAEEPVKEFKVPPKPEFKVPKLDDPEINGDWDKLQMETIEAQRRYSEQMVDWSDQRRNVQYQEEQYKREQENKRQAKEVELAQRANDEKLKEVRDRWSNILDVGKSKYSDFDEKTQFNHPKKITNTVISEALLHLDEAPDLIYYISTHPDEANKLVEQTMLPEKDGKLAATPQDWEKALRKAYVTLGRWSTSIVEKAAEESDVSDDLEDLDDNTIPVVVAPDPPAPAPVAVAPPKPPTTTVSGPPKPAVKPKPVPPTPLKPGTGGGYRKLRDMTAEEMASLHPDDYRKRYENGEMR